MTFSSIPVFISELMWTVGNQSLHRVFLQDPDPVSAVFVMESPEFVHAFALITIPEARRKGYGTRLMHHVFSTFNKKVFIEVEPFLIQQSTGSIPGTSILRSWYARLGFKTVLGHPFAMYREPVESDKPNRN